jgi:hypothetical protein
VVCSPFACSVSLAWRVSGDEIQPVDIPELNFAQYDISGQTGQVLYASHFPDKGAGPSNLSASDLWIYDPATQESQLVFDHENVVEALWTPDGGAFVYLLATPESYELRWRSLAGEDILLARDVIPTFSISPSGSQVAFTRETGYNLPGAPGLYTVSITGQGEKQISSADRHGAGSISDQPLWSPDEQHIILPLQAEGLTYPFVLINTDGSKTIPLSYTTDVPQTVQERVITPVLWHPDGGHLLGVNYPGMMDPIGSQEIATFALNLENGQISSVQTVFQGTALPLDWQEPGKSAWVLEEGKRLYLLDLAEPALLPASCSSTEQASYANRPGGFCLRYPNRFSVVEEQPGRVTISGPALDESLEPLAARLWIEWMDAAEGVDLQAAADDFVKKQPASQPAITQQPFSLGGAPAILLENVPGKLSSRVILAVYGGKIYRLWFNPTEPTLEQVKPDLDELFKSVTETFAFLPRSVRQSPT